MMRSRSTKMSLPWSSTGDATFQSRRDGIFVARAYDKYPSSPIGAAYSAIHPDSSYNHRVDRTAAAPCSFETCPESSGVYSCSLAELPAAVGHSDRSA
jgi:hypothetical protein